RKKYRGMASGRTPGKIEIGRASCRERVETSVAAVKINGNIDHAAFLGTINPDTNKIPKHLFQGYLNIYNNYFKAPWMPDRTEANPFFFSSRRRHTRWPRDWSSDVCSSDLSEEIPRHGVRADTRKD